MSSIRKRTLNEDDDDLSEPGPSQREKMLATNKALFQRSEGGEDFEPQDYSQSQTNITQETITEITNNAVIQILCQNYKLRPFKRSDILHNTKARGKIANQIMDDVKKKLFDIFGLHLMEIEHQKYIVVNPMHKRLERYVHEQKTPRKDLLGLLLTIIFVNNMQIHEDRLRECLQKVKVDLIDNHPYFGDVIKHLQEFEKQLYIVKDYVTSTIGQEKPEPFYIWGIRAKHEISMNLIMDVLAKKYDLTIDHLPPSLRTIALKSIDPESSPDFP